MDRCPHSSWWVAMALLLLFGEHKTYALRSFGLLAIPFPTVIALSSITKSNKSGC
jgi:hypothetical protein